MTAVPPDSGPPQSSDNEAAAAVADLEERLARSPLAPAVRRRHPLGPRTTYRVGGPARLFVPVRNRAALDLVASCTAGSEAPVPVLVLGRGSNLLVADAGFCGLALALEGDLAGFGVSGTTVRAGGGAPLPKLARRTVAEGLTGFEWAVGVPGSMGGAVRMNAGGHGSDTAAVLDEAEIVDLRLGSAFTAAADDLGLGYRTSRVAPHQVVAEARLRLAPGDPAAGRALLSEIVAWRRANQPGGQNSGSVFTNPDGDSAGRLIDAAGARGLRMGTARVSPKHANFIQSDEGGSAADVAALMAEVRRRVAESCGVDLVAETCLVGFEPGPAP